MTVELNDVVINTDVKSKSYLNVEIVVGIETHEEYGKCYIDYVVTHVRTDDKFRKVDVKKIDWKYFEENYRKIDVGKYDSREWYGE